MGGIPVIRPSAAKQLPAPGPCPGPVMLVDAIVFGMVGVAAGFTWEYVIKRGR